MSRCTQCSWTLQEGAKFCGNCGAPVPGAAQEPTAAPASPSKPRPTVLTVVGVAAFLLFALVAGGGVTWLLLQRSPSPESVVKDFISAPCEGYQSLTYVDDGNRASWATFGATCTQALAYSNIQITEVGSSLGPWQSADHSCYGDPPATVQKSGSIRTTFSWTDGDGAPQSFDGVTCVVQQRGSWYVYTTGH